MLRCTPIRKKKERNINIEKHQVAEVEFVPNRLVIFDGRIPHGADAPNESARYMDRKSLVVRGDEIELVKDQNTRYLKYSEVEYKRNRTLL